MNDTPIKVDSRTLGTSINYHLSTADLSRTGMKLTMGNYKQVPFGINTLLEMTIDPSAEIFAAPVHCLGKIVRKEKGGNKTDEYGVQIVQLDGQDAADWDVCISALERKSNKTTENIVIEAA